jgi:hypothetical protein
MDVTFERTHLAVQIPKFLSRILKSSVTDGGHGASPCFYPATGDFARWVDELAVERNDPMALSRRQVNLSREFQIVYRESVVKCGVERHAGQIVGSPEQSNQKAVETFPLADMRPAAGVCQA